MVQYIGLETNLKKTFVLLFLIDQTFLCFSFPELEFADELGPGHRRAVSGNGHSNGDARNNCAKHADRDDRPPALQGHRHRRATGARAASPPTSRE